jgi:hypothetical protein
MTIDGFDQRMEVAENEWVPLPGGELEAPRQGALCPACRAARHASERSGAPAAGARTLCFECHRAEARRRRALAAAGRVFTGSEERLQTGLPFEPVDRVRLARLKTERMQARLAEARGPERHANRRRHAQLEARHALAAIARGLRARDLPLPPSWLPFVVNR